MSDKTPTRDLGFTYIYPELDAGEQQRKDELLREHVRPLLPSRIGSVAELVRRVLISQGSR